MERRKVKVDNALIMAAGTASRFAPISYEKPKALIKVRGEVLIERQIKQLRQAGIEEIYLVTGYKKEQFEYLKDKFNVHLIENREYLTRNNNSSIYAAKEVIRNTYICSSDNYFVENPFESEVDSSYYATVYSLGKTDEWCVFEDSDGIIRNVKIGGEKSRYMLGHVFWREDFSNKFLKILEDEYEKPETKSKLWETIYIDHINELEMKARHYDSDFIFEFDSLEELRGFDPVYVNDSGSEILHNICKSLDCLEGQIVDIKVFKGSDNEAAGFDFKAKDRIWRYTYREGTLNEKQKD